MKCTICRREVKLIPSALQRAARHGGRPSDYVALFTTHTECFLRKREQDTLVLMRRLVAEAKTREVYL